MNRILLVDLGERELKKRQELRARRQILETMKNTAATSGGLSPKQDDELEAIRKQLASDVTTDPFYQLVAATHQQKDWATLVASAEYIHEYGLVGSQRTTGSALSPLKEAEREIVAICGLLQVDGYTDAARPDFVQRVSVAQGEYRKNRKLFDAAFVQLGDRYKVGLQSQVSAGLIDRHVLGCIVPGGNPETRDQTGDFESAKRDAVARASATETQAISARDAASSAANAQRNAEAALAAAEAEFQARQKEATLTPAQKKATAPDVLLMLSEALKRARASLKSATTAAKVASIQATTTAATATAAEAAATAARAAAADAEVEKAIAASVAASEPGANDIVCSLSARNLAAVVRRLATDGVSANDAWLASRVQNVYDMQTGVVAGAPPSAMEIMLPDLDEASDVEIIRENLHAVQAIYFAYMLEEMRLPQVVERIVELFRAGLLPLGRGKAGDPRSSARSRRPSSSGRPACTRSSTARSRSARSTSSSPSSSIATARTRSRLCWTRSRASRSSTRRRPGSRSRRTTSSSRPRRRRSSRATRPA